MPKQTNFQVQARQVVGTLEDQHKYDLPTLRRLGVYAEPVNNMVTPAATGATQLASALAEAKPEVTGFLNNLSSEIKDGEKKKRQAAQEFLLNVANSQQQARTFREVYGKNEDPAYDPLTISKHDEITGNRVGTEYSTYLQEELSKSGLQNTTDPSAYGSFVKEARARFFDQRGISDTYSSNAAYASGFETQARKTEEALILKGKETANNNVSDTILGGYGDSVIKTIPTFRGVDGSINQDALAKFMNEQGDILLAGQHGISGTKLNKLNSEMLVQLAVEQRDPRILDLADKLKAGSGNLSGTTSWIMQRNEAIKKIDYAEQVHAREKQRIRHEAVDSLNDAIAETIKSGKDPYKLLKDDRFSVLSEIEKRRFIHSGVEVMKYQQNTGGPAPFDTKKMDFIQSMVESTGDDPEARMRLKAQLTLQAHSPAEKKYINEAFTNAKFSNPHADEGYKSALIQLKADHKTTDYSIGSDSFAPAFRSYREKWAEAYTMSGEDLYSTYKDVIPESHKDKPIYLLPRGVKEKIGLKMVDSLKKTTTGSSGLAVSARPGSLGSKAVVGSGEKVTQGRYNITRTE